MYYKRDIENTILEAAKSFPSIVLYGSRQVGKSTTADHIFSDKLKEVTLDDPDELALALENPKGFLDVHPWPLLIDEVQKAPILFSVIKERIDEQKKIWLKNNGKRELMYLLTGSNQFELQQSVSESLAGRAAVIDMASMTQLETLQSSGNLFIPDIPSLIKKENESNLQYVGKNEIFQRIFRGGMPDVVTGVSEKEIYFKSYIRTYIEKDVKKLISATSEAQFIRFMHYIALRTAQQVNYEVFSRELGIDSDTCRRWMSILATSGIIVLLQPYMANLSNRIIKAPKLFFMDTGLCSYLCGWPNAEMLQDCAMSGAFFETFVVSEIVKSFYNAGKEIKNTLFYYRDIDQKEVDLLYILNDCIYPIEIKKGEAPTKPTKNFKFLEKYGKEIKTGLIIDSSDKIRPINDKAYSFPVYLLGI